MIIDSLQFLFLEKELPLMTKSEKLKVNSAKYQKNNS